MKSTFGEFLASKRKEKGLTQKDLANILYVSESTISKWEQNRANPDITIIPTLSNLLGVSEHELITASIDTEQRENIRQAKKWRHLTFSWNLFFLIAYSITIFTCFICNLATSHTLSWFWIVLSSLMLGASFTNLPRYVKKFRLLTLSTSPLLSLILLLAICCIYSSGNWFWVTISPIIFAFAIIFMPIYVKHYKFPSIIKKHRTMFCSIFGFGLLIAMLYIIENFALKNNFTNTRWATSYALPMSSYCLGITLLLIFVIRYLKINRWFKTSCSLLIFTLAWLPTQTFLYFLQNKVWGSEITNYYLPNLNDWSQLHINANINFIITLSLFFLCVTFGTIGFIWHNRKNKKS